MNRPPQPCPPFTPCWCETRPNNPNCKPSLSIDYGISVLFVLAIFVGLLKIKLWRHLKN